MPLADAGAVQRSLCAVLVPARAQHRQFLGDFRFPGARAAWRPGRAGRAAGAADAADRLGHRRGYAHYGDAGARWRALIGVTAAVAGLIMSTVAKMALLSFCTAPGKGLVIALATFGAIGIAQWPLPIVLVPWCCRSVSRSPGCGHEGFRRARDAGVVSFRADVAVRHRYANSAVPEIQQRFADDVQHWMTDPQFSDIFGLAQLTPGPNVIVVTLIGYHVAGLTARWWRRWRCAARRVCWLLGVGRTFDRFPRRILAGGAGRWPGAGDA